MNTQMSNSLHSEKLDHNNFSSWEYKMHQYLVGQGYWSYIKGALETKYDITNVDYPTWQQGPNWVIYCLATCVYDHMLSHIRDRRRLKKHGRPG